MEKSYTVEQVENGYHALFTYYESGRKVFSSFPEMVRDLAIHFGENLAFNPDKRELLLGKVATIERELEFMDLEKAAVGEKAK